MSRLKNLSKQVQQILEDYPITRGDDRLLITTLYIRCYGVRPNAGFGEVMKDYTLPPFESIRRSRQKIQETRADLRANADVEQIRMDLQEEYIEFAREGV